MIRWNKGTLHSTPPQTQLEIFQQCGFLLVCHFTAEWLLFCIFSFTDCYCKLHHSELQSFLPRDFFCSAQETKIKARAACRQKGHRPSLLFKHIGSYTELGGNLNTAWVTKKNNLHAIIPCEEAGLLTQQHKTERMSIVLSASLCMRTPYILKGQWAVLSQQVLSISQHWQSHN